MGIGAVAASFTLFYSVWAAGICLTFAALITLTFTVFRKNSLNKGVVIALIFIILTARLVSVALTAEKTNESLVGKSADIRAQIISVDYGSNSFTSVSLKVLDSTKKAANGKKLKATFMYKTEALPGDIISARAVFTQPDDEFRTKNYGDGYYYSADIGEIYSYESCRTSFWRIIHNVRETIASAIEQTGKDENSAVLKALIIGDKSDISPEFNTLVRNSGVSHMLVVSGMHLGIICGVLMNLLKRRTKQVTAVIIGSVAALFMLVVCLLHVSVLRAGIAYIAMLLARLFKRNFEPLSALGFGVAAAVALNPYIFYNVAFLLSVTATFAVLYPARLLINAVSFVRFRKIGTILRYIYDIIIISVCSIFCTLPIAVEYFGYVVLAAPITNLAVSMAVSCALIIGVLAVLLIFLPFGIYAAMPVFAVARAFTSFFIRVVEVVGKEGLGVIFVDKGKSIYCFAVAIAFILLIKQFGFCKKRRKEKSYAK